MSSKVAVKVLHLSKCFRIYKRAHERLFQILSFGRKQYYREFWALKDVSFEIQKGETVGIIGHNGSGKSTLLQLICGTLNPTKGHIETNGRVAALLELGSGFNPEFTGRENVYMNASILGLSKDEINHRFDKIIDFANMHDFIDQPVKTYSSGMMLRLAFSVIAHVDADILIVDEALAVGDAVFTQKCMRFLRDFMKTGTVLFVSHDAATITSLCNRAIWMEKGNIIKEGPPKEVCELYHQACYEAQQGKSEKTKFIPLHKIQPREIIKDQRMRFINCSNLRNDLQLFKFDPDARSFGKGGAQIYDVHLIDESREPLSWIVGGETVTLCILVQAHIHLDSPIIGFYIKNNLGQILFGDNSYLSYSETPIHCKEGSKLHAEFVFSMPVLPAGSYSITATIANGTQSDHEQHHWMYDAVLFKSQSSSVPTGLVGIPMQSILLTPDDSAEIQLNTEAV